MVGFTRLTKNQIQRTLCRTNKQWKNKTPAIHRDFFRLRLAKIRHLIENLPPPWYNAIYFGDNVKTRT